MLRDPNEQEYMWKPKALSPTRSGFPYCGLELDFFTNIGLERSVIVVQMSRFFQKNVIVISVTQHLLGRIISSHIK